MSIREKNAAKISGFALYFKELARSSYKRTHDGIYKLFAPADSNYEEEWVPPHEAIERKLNSQIDSLWLDHIRGREKVFLTSIQNWFHENNITELSLYGQGDTATAYEAKINGNNDSRLIVRIGGEYTKPDVVFRRVWCPIVLQPFSKTIFETLKYYRIALEKLPLVKLVGGSDTIRFGEFLNETLLYHTPYEVHINKDLGILPDGTPVYIDPGSLNFKHIELAKRFDELQYTPKWQQGVMETIFCMSKGLGYKEPLSWVVEDSNGIFVTKQATLYAPSFPERPSVSRIINVDNVASLT